MMTVFKGSVKLMWDCLLVGSTLNHSTAMTAMRRLIVKAHGSTRSVLLK